MKKQNLKKDSDLPLNNDINVNFRCCLYFQGFRGSKFLNGCLVL